MRTEFSSALLGERYTRVEHPSGLSVYVFPKKMSGTYALLATRYGSTDVAFSVDGSPMVKPPDGVAHFLEHKLFDNPDGSDAFARFSALGADANAYTAYTRTAYLFSATEHVREALEELIYFVTHPHFTEASVKKEQGIIAEEIKMYADNPWERGYQNLLAALYHRHPIRRNICGSVASIKRITPKVLEQCYRAFYRPENMALVVSGDITVDAVMEAVEAALPPPEPPIALVRGKCEEPPEPRRTRVSCRMQVSKPLFHIGIKDTVLPHEPEARLRRDLAINLLGDILFSQSGDFYSEMFESGRITPSYSADYSTLEGFGYYCIAGESDDPDGVMEALLSYLSRVMREGIDPEAFERCRRAMYADEIRAYDSTEEIANRLLTFVFDGSELFAPLSVLQSFTVREMETLAAELFRPEQFALSAVYPLNSQNERTETT